MNPILLINTALETAYAAVANGDTILAEQTNRNQKEHARFLHPAIKTVLDMAGTDFGSLKAVSVIVGPGSYTGLRVGMSAAKGICFACSIPLISVNTLEWMVESVKNQDFTYYVPMIDARRNEVFTGVYDHGGRELLAPFARILQQGEPFYFTAQGPTLFFGSGAEKASGLVNQEQASFVVNNPAGAREHATISHNRFKSKHFADIAYEEPLYAKEFYTSGGNRQAN